MLEIFYDYRDSGGGLPQDEILFSPETLLEIRDNFTAELRSAHKAHLTAAENRTSLPFITDRFQLPPSPLVSEGEEFEAVEIGGSKITRARLRKTANGLAILDKEGPLVLPSIKTLDEFHVFLDQVIYPNVGVVAINFANTMRQVFERGRLDGIITGIDDTRAVSVHDLIGKVLGVEIEDYISSRRNSPIITSVAGDGLCMVLSAKSIDPQKNNLGFVIVGKGYNAGLLLNSTTFVNLDAASFDKFPMSALASELSQQTGWPFGKEVNGSHLFKHYNRAVQDRGITVPLIQSTEELSAVALGNITGIPDLAKKYFARAAQLVACQMAGIAEFMGLDMIIVPDGSVFWKGVGFKETVADTTRQLTGKNVQFVEIEDRAIIGAAMLVV